MKRKACHILIIDDNLHHAELLTELLDKHFQPVVIHAVDSFDDALKLLNTTIYDLIISESLVGQQKLSDNISSIKKSSADAPIVVISGSGDERLAVKLSRMGAADYMPKTRETLEKLPERLEGHLQKRRAVSNGYAVDVLPPTKIQMLEEVDKLTQEALFVTSQSMRRVPPKQKQMERILDSLSKLKKMVERL